jgi:hypothetical protein
MGITVSVKVEGETTVPVEARTDGKPLADIVAGWIWFAEVIDVLGLQRGTVEALKRIDTTMYGGSEEEAEAAWQAPAVAKAALEELRATMQRLRDDPVLREKARHVSKGKSAKYFEDSWFSEWAEAYDMGTEDAIKVCDWAATRNKRVAFVSM